MSKVTNLNLERGSRRRHTVYGILVIVAVLSAAIGLWLFYSLQIGFGAIAPGILLLTVSLAAWLVGLYLIQHNAFEKGVELGLVVFMIVMPLTSLFIAERGLPVGIMAAASIIFLATSALPPARAQWFFVGAIFVALATIGLDAYVPFQRLVLPFGPAANSTILVAILLLGLGVLLARNFGLYPLRVKLLLGFVIVAILSVTAVTYFSTVSIRNSLAENSARDLRTRAQSAALSIGLTMDRNVDRLQTFSLDKRVQDDVTQITDSYPPTAAERVEMVARNAKRWAGGNSQDGIVRSAMDGQLAYSLRQFSEVFQGNKELIMTDAYGAVIAATDLTPTYDFSNAEWWKNAYNGGRGSVYVGQPEFDPMIQDHGVRVALPIYAPGRQRAVGVIHSIYTLTALQRALLLNAFGESGKIDLLFPLGQILTSEGTFRALTPHEFAEVQEGLNKPLATLNYRGTALLSSQGVIRGSDEPPLPYLSSSAWRTIATIQADEVLGAADDSAKAAVFAGIATIGLAVLVALWLAQILTRPIRRLTTVAQEIQGGDLGARATIETGDEIGMLAQTFNGMTARLQDTLAGLERRVAERTQGLVEANLALQANSSYLSALSDTSTGLFERLKRNELLQAIVERAGALADTQHGFVFFAEPGDKDIQMRVGLGLYDDLVGTRAQRGVGLAGTVWQTGQPLSIGDYQKWEGRLPGTRRDALHAVVAVPLMRAIGQGTGDEIVGVIGLAYTEPDKKFGNTVIEILQRFAQLASIALDNAQLYANSERRIEELGALNSISLIITQESELQPLIQRIGDEVCRIFSTDFAYIALLDPQSEQIEFPYVMDNGKPLVIPPLRMGQGLTSQVITTRQPMLLTDVSGADYRGMGAVNSGDGSSPASLLTVPVLAGDRVLGALSVQRTGVTRNFTPDDQRLLTTIAANVGVGIENVRLFEQTQAGLAETDRLYRIAEAANLETDAQGFYKRIHEIVGQALNAKNFLVALYNADDGTIGVPYQADERGTWRERARDGAHAVSGITAHVLRQREPLLATKQEIHALAAQGELQLHAGEPEAWLGVPMLVGERAIGVVAVQSYAADFQYTESDKQTLVKLSQGIANAVERKRAEHELQVVLAETQRLAASARESAEQVTALNRRLTREGWREYLDQFSSTLVFEAGDGDTGNGHGIRRSNPNAGPGDGNNGDGHEKIRVPIQLRGEVIGEIELEGQDEAAPWSEQDLGLVTHVAENIGLALDNVRLFTETQRRVTELNALNNISQAVSTELDLETLLNVIGDQVRTIFDVQSTYIAMYDRETEMISLPYMVADNQRVSVEPIRFGEGITSHIIRQRAPLILNENTAQALEKLGAKEVGKPARSYLGVPIFVGEQVTGVISIQSTEREGLFDDSNVRLMETIAATVGATIQNAQLYGAMQQEVVTRQRAEEEIKLSLKEKEVLLKEIHHRVKNNLQIITSLLNLQSAQIKDPEASVLFRESQARVRSMALIHEKLYQSKDLARIDFDSYVRDLMVYLFRSYAANSDQIQLHIATNDMFLAIDTAIPCGLIVSELVTNTIKYAFPNGKRGDLFIALGPEDDGHLTLSVRDTGVGFAEGFDWRESDSLGLQLVSTLSSQLHGTIQVDGRNGTSFKITFPG